MILSFIWALACAAISFLLLKSLTLREIEEAPLFPSSSKPTTTNVTTLHTNLSSLLPILPLITEQPSGVLLVTLVTPAFKPLFLNWLCFLRFKARWGSPEAEKPNLNLLKLLILTSDEALAKEFSSLGVVVWFMRSHSQILATTSTSGSDTIMKTSNMSNTKVEVHSDIFSSLSLLNLLFDSTTASKSKIITWGSFRYQSLMLERSIAISVLIGAIVEENRLTDRNKSSMLYKFGNQSHFPHQRIRGVLMADNDAVWLSSPTSFLFNSTSRLQSSLKFSLDSPPTSLTAWGTKSGTPCACFIYSTTYNNQTKAYLSIPEPRGADISREAAAVWRKVALCHIALVLKSRYSEVATSLGVFSRPIVAANLSGEDTLGNLRAPSFQANCLGPVLHIADQREAVSSSTLPSLSHFGWMELLQSNRTGTLTVILKDILEGPPLIEIAKSIRTRDSAPKAFLKVQDASSYNSLYQRRALQVESLPFNEFPSGKWFFHDNPNGVAKRPVVIHANYIVGSEKENFLRKRKLWVLKGSEQLGWTCDLTIMKEV